MYENQNIWMCTECGHTASNRFPEDICPRCNLTYWKCADCSYTLAAQAAPDICPECHQKCRFLNITCYIPDWEIPELAARQNV
jgi:rubrerythrin